MLYMEDISTFISIRSNIKIFKLKELYKQHKDIVMELLIKKAYYPKHYVEELKGFGFSKDEIYHYLLGNYKKDKVLSLSLTRWYV